MRLTAVTPNRGARFPDIHELFPKAGFLKVIRRPDCLQRRCAAGGVFQRRQRQATEMLEAGTGLQDAVHVCQVGNARHYADEVLMGIRVLNHAGQT